MKTLQGGLLNEDDCCEEFMAFVSHLMRFALEDPGMANPKEVRQLLSSQSQKLNQNPFPLIRVCNFVWKLDTCAHFGFNDDIKSNL